MEERIDFESLESELKRVEELIISDYIDQATQILTPIIVENPEIVNGKNGWQIFNLIDSLIEQDPAEATGILTPLAQNPEIVNRNKYRMFESINLLIKQNSAQAIKILTQIIQSKNLNKLSPKVQIDLASSLIRLAGATQGEEQQQYLKQATEILTPIVQNPEMVNENDFQIFNSINLLIKQNPVEAAGILTPMAQPENLNQLNPRAQINLVNNLIRLAGAIQGEEQQQYLKQATQILTAMAQNPEIVNNRVYGWRIFNSIDLLIRQNHIKQATGILTLMVQPKNLNKLSPRAQINLANSLIGLAGATQGEERQQYLAQAAKIPTPLAQSENLNQLDPRVQIDLTNNLTILTGANQDFEQRIDMKKQQKSSQQGI